LERRVVRDGGLKGGDPVKGSRSKVIRLSS